MKNNQESQALDQLSYQCATTEMQHQGPSHVFPTAKLMGLDY